jgi:putative peptidoglycan lipid II flippase
MFSSIKKLFIKQNSVRGASLILIATLAVSNVLGVLRDHFLAQKIPTDRLDIYYAAFRLPDLIFNVLILGAVAAAFVPIYSSYIKERGEKEANELAQSVISIALVAIMVGLVILFFLLPYLAKFTVPNFNPVKRQETVVLARWLLLSPMFFTVSYFFGGILNSHKRFLAYSMAPLVYNICIILSVLFFGESLGVKGVVFGVIAGTILHLLVQLPATLSTGFKPGWRFDFKDKGVMKIIGLMVPRSIGLGANQVLLLAFTGFASAFPGSVAIYSLSDNIQTVPSVIFGTSFATAVFPTLASLSLSAPEDKEKFRSFLTKTVRAALFFLIPSTAVLFVLRAQIIRLILGYGFFSWSDTKLASATLGFFALSIVAQGLVPIFSKSFYAISDTRTPMFASIVSIAVSIASGFILTRHGAAPYGAVAGLALAFSIGSWVNLLILALYLNKKVEINRREILNFSVGCVAMTLVAVGAMQYGKSIVAANFDIDRVRYLLLQAVITLVVGAIVYFALAWLFKVKEVRS